MITAETCYVRTHELRNTYPSCKKKTIVKHSIHKSTIVDRAKIGDFIRRFWGEEEQLAFDVRINVAKLSAYVAKVKYQIVGFVFFMELDDSSIIVTLGIQPKYQGGGVGRSLVAKAEEEAR